MIVKRDVLVHEETSIHCCSVSQFSIKSYPPPLIGGDYGYTMEATALALGTFEIDPLPPRATSSYYWRLITIGTFELASKIP